MKQELLAMLIANRGPVSTQRIAATLGIRKPEVQKLVSTLLQDGQPIIGGRRGFEIAQSHEQVLQRASSLKRAAQKLTAHAELLTRTANAITRDRPEFSKQIALF